MQSGGSIQSQNYVAGKSGFKIASNGEAEFANGVFRGEIHANSGYFNGTVVATNGKFTGEIDSGPLKILKGEHHTGRTIHFSAGWHFDYFGDGNDYTFLQDGVAVNPEKSHWNGTPIKYIKTSSTSGGYLKITYIENNSNSEKTWTSKKWNWELPCDFVVSTEFDNLYTLRLLNLPQFNPNISGAVYISKGSLMICE